MATHLLPRTVARGLGRASLRVLIVLRVLMGVLMRALMRALMRVLLPALLSLWMVPAQADTADSERALDSTRQRLDAVQKTLSNPPPEIDLSAPRAETVAIGAAADLTAAGVQPQLTSAQARLDQLGSSSAGEDPRIATLRATLERSRTGWLTQLRFARLLSLESTQLLLRIDTLRRARKEDSLGTKMPSILAPAFWSALRRDAGPESDRLRALGAELAAAARAVPLSVGFAVAGCSIALAALGLWARRWSQRLASTVVPSGRLRRSVDAWASIAIAVAVPGLIGLVWRAGIGASGALSPATESLLDSAVKGVCFAAYGLGLGQALLCAKRPSWRLLPLPDNAASGLRHFPVALATVFLAEWLADGLAARVDASAATLLAVRCSGALLLGVGVAWAQVQRERLRRQHAAGASGTDADVRPLWAGVLAGAVWIALAASVLCVALGYEALGTLVIKQFVWIGLVVGSAYLLNVFIEDISQAFIASPDPGDVEGASPAAIGRALLRDQAAVVLSGGMKILVIAAAVLLVITPVGESPAELLRRAALWSGDWSVGEVKLRPRAAIEAVVVLVVGLLAVAALKRWLGTRYLPTTGLDKDVQASAVTMFGYAGAVTAVLLALSASGLGLDRVAWIASALSVGIGFGLQGVTQNFISGLILLAERPVKVGDWVSLGEVEGDIRRINLRATEVQLADRSTAIVPNSEFITKAVRNVTHGNPVGLVQISLPMPLTTDVDRVREMLLEAFAVHADLLGRTGTGGAPCRHRRQPAGLQRHRLCQLTPAGLRGAQCGDVRSAEALSRSRRGRLGTTGGAVACAGSARPVESNRSEVLS